jgi:hypothetical protein
MSEYEKLKQKGMGRGRPRLTPEQKAQSQAVNLARQEARRRAHIVLKNRHADEFAEIYEQEMNTIISSTGITPKPKKKSTRK